MLQLRCHFATELIWLVAGPRKNVHSVCMMFVRFLWRFSALCKLPGCFVSDGEVFWWAMWDVVGTMGNVIWCYQSDENTFLSVCKKGKMLQFVLSLSAKAVLTCRWPTYRFPLGLYDVWEVFVKVFSIVQVARVCCQRWLGVLVSDVACCGHDGGVWFGVIAAMRTRSLSAYETLFAV